MSKAIYPIVLMLVLCGCAGMTETQQRMTTGTLGGTAAGAAIGAMAGNAGLGAGIGAGVGLLGSYLYDQHKKSERANSAIGDVCQGVVAEETSTTRDRPCCGAVISDDHA